MAHVDFSAIINDFLTAELGEDVRDSLVAIAEALETAINTQVASITTDLSSADPNAAPQAGRIGTIIYRGRDAATNTPRVPTWYSGLDESSKTQKFSSIPRWSVCSASGAKVKSMILNTPSVVFPDTAIIRDTLTYVIAKISLGTTHLDPAAMIYEMKSIDGAQKWVGYSLSSTPDAVIWRRDSGLLIYTLTDIPNKSTQPEEYAEFCDAFFNRLPAWSRTSVNGEVLIDSVGSGFPDPGNLVATRTYMIDKEQAGSYNKTDIYHIFTYSTGRSWYGYKLASWSPTTKPSWFRYTTPTDSSLTVAGAPADAAAVGDKLQGYGTVKILCFGNSFTYSTLGLLPALLKEAGVSVKMGILYASGLNVEGQTDHLINDTPYSEYSLCDGTTWTNTGGTKTGKQALADEKWDFIVIQPSIFVDKVAELVDTILTARDEDDEIIVNYPVAFLMNQQQAYGANDYRYDEHPNEAASDARAVRLAIDCSVLVDGGTAEGATVQGLALDWLPCGTAVQNARQITAFKSIGTEGYLCDDDHSHLQNGLGTLIPSYAAAIKILGLIGSKARGFGYALRPTDIWLQNTYHLWTATMHGSCVGVTDANVLLGMKCAVQAVKHPTEITVVF